MRRTLAFFALAAMLALSALLPAHCGAEVIDRVVAYVDNSAITLNRLEEAYEKTRSGGEDKTRLEVLEGMINKRLLLREAKRLRIEGKDEEAIIGEYINLRVAPFVRIGANAAREFYEKNRGSFEGVEFKDARGQIEELLVKEETIRMLEEHVKKLRANARIRIMLE